MKNPPTPAGIEPATFRFVAQHLNHCATAVAIIRKKGENLVTAEKENGHVVMEHLLGIQELLATAASSPRDVPHYAVFLSLPLLPSNVQVTSQYPLLVRSQPMCLL